MQKSYDWFASKQFLSKSSRTTSYVQYFMKFQFNILGVVFLVAHYFKEWYWTSIMRCPTFRLSILRCTAQYLSLQSETRGTPESEHFTAQLEHTKARN